MIPGGAVAVCAIQDIDGFREAAGTRIANEIIAQCSHKALLRMESDESARWASRVIGQYETLDIMQSKQGGMLGRGGSQLEQAARRDTVLYSEFYLIPATNPKNGLTGLFVLPSTGALREKITSAIIRSVVTVKTPDVSSLKDRRRNDSENGDSMRTETLERSRANARRCKQVAKDEARKADQAAGKSLFAERVLGLTRPTSVQNN